jgi:hypothetical protein
VLAHLSGDPALTALLRQAGVQGDAFRLIASQWLGSGGAASSDQLLVWLLLWSCLDESPAGGDSATRCWEPMVMVVKHPVLSFFSIEYCCGSWPGCRRPGERQQGGPREGQACHMWVPDSCQAVVVHGAGAPFGLCTAVAQVALMTCVPLFALPCRWHHCEWKQVAFGIWPPKRFSSDWRAFDQGWLMHRAESNHSCCHNPTVPAAPVLQYGLTAFGLAQGSGALGISVQAAQVRPQPSHVWVVPVFC